jgi:type IV pilus assembly protein PilW
MKHARRNQSGFFLIEALVAILIFSLGILGMVALGGTAMGAQTDARYRTDAAALADEMASAIVINVARDTAANFLASLNQFQHRPTGADCAFRRRRHRRAERRRLAGPRDDPGERLAGSAERHRRQPADPDRHLGHRLQPRPDHGLLAGAERPGDAPSHARHLHQRSGATDMKPYSRVQRGSVQRGFTLIEVLVGLGIGLIGVVLMFRMVALWETHSRSAIAGSDTQVSGTLAMFSLERDLKQAGMGFGNADAPYMGCAVTAQNGGTPINIPAFVPVRIVPGAGALSDQVEVLYGDSSFYGGNAPAPDPSLPAAILRRDLQFKSSTATTKTLERRGMFRTGDIAIVAGNEIPTTPASATCHLIEVTDASNPDNLTIGHATGNYVSFYSTTASGVNRFNPAGGTGGTFVAGRIYNLGPAPQRNIWTVRADGTLTRSDAMRPALPPVDVAERVVKLKAEYGIDTDGDRRPDVWQAAPPVSGDWTTVLAVRTALLVRSRQYETSIDPNTNVAFAVTPTAQNPCWADCAGVHRFVMTNIDGTADAFNDVLPDPNNCVTTAIACMSERCRFATWSGYSAVNASRISPAGLGRDGQRGIVMWVALIVLIVMSLAGLAMLRQMGTGISVRRQHRFQAERDVHLRRRHRSCASLVHGTAHRHPRERQRGAGLLRDVERDVGRHGRSDPVQLGHRRGDRCGGRRRRRHGDGQHQPIHHPAPVPEPRHGPGRHAGVLGPRGRPEP